MNPIISLITARGSIGCHPGGREASIQVTSLPASRAEASLVHWWLTEEAYSNFLGGALPPPCSNSNCAEIHPTFEDLGKGKPGKFCVMLALEAFSEVADLEKMCWDHWKWRLAGPYDGRQEASSPEQPDVVAFPHHHLVTKWFFDAQCACIRKLLLNSSPPDFCKIQGCPR